MTTDLGSRLRAIDYRYWLGNLALVVLGVSVVLAGFEAGLRLGVIGEDDDEFRWCEGPSERAAFHETYGWTEHPNATYLRKSTAAAGWNRYSTTAEGFRDTYDSGEDDVVVLGDSFTWGTLAGDNATYPYLLDRWLPDTAVHNYGMGGYGTGNELAVYRDVAPDYDHDLVVVGYYVNDPNNNADTHPRRPQFRVRNGTLRQVHEPVRTQADHGVVEGARSFLEDHVRVYDYFYPKAKAAYNWLGGGRAVNRPAPTGATLDRRLSLTRALLGEIATVAGRHDAEVLVVFVPPRGVVRPDEPVQYPIEGGKPYYDAQRAMVTELARNRSNVSALDLTPALERTADEDTRVYGRTNAHLTERGYRVAARTIHEWLRNQTHLPGDGPADYDRSYDDETPTCPG